LNNGLIGKECEISEIIDISLKFQLLTV